MGRRARYGNNYCRYTKQSGEQGKYYAMKYLLDTDTSVFFLRKEKTIVDRIKKIDNTDIAISIITLAELQYGASNSPRIQENTDRMEGFRKLFANLPLSTEITAMFGDQKTNLRKSGNLIADFDILIGSTAIVNGLILITNNVKHFSRLSGITIENWLSV
jgi:tRNA(fMet)-specific endonuclease VapC